MKERLPEIARAAVASERATGCPAELQVAQCALETGWLRHAPGNNCFGIKAYAGAYGRQQLVTTEWFTLAERDRFIALGDGRDAQQKMPTAPPRHDGRVEYAVRDWFATFPTLGACFVRRAAMWDRGRYAAAAQAYRQTHDLPALVHAIAPIYATDPNYASQVLSIIQSADVQEAIRAARAEVASA